MLVFTVSTGFAESVLDTRLTWKDWSPHLSSDSEHRLARRLLGVGNIREAELATEHFWPCLYIEEFAQQSQFDSLSGLSPEEETPERILCLGGSSTKFHGFKGRPWAALPGNLHLSLFLRPDSKLRLPSAAFMVLAVVSVLQTLDRFPTLRDKASVKWVNDILIEEAKIGGVLATVQTQGEEIKAATLGIGINVETTPQVSATPFVPAVACLADFLGHRKAGNLPAVFRLLLRSLAQNYQTLLGGGYPHLLEQYRSRSLVIGRKVGLYRDQSAAWPARLDSGRVNSIGLGLELFLEGRTKPFSNCRLALED
jgi:BirA family biotin operon repressor/biotin-[acetyl-CoA-carboxylase] ligase